MRADPVTQVGMEKKQFYFSPGQKKPEEGYAPRPLEIPTQGEATMRFRHGMSRHAIGDSRSTAYWEALATNYEKDLRLNRRRPQTDFAA